MPLSDYQCPSDYGQSSANLSHLPTNYFDPYSRTLDNSRMQRDRSAGVPTPLVACREELQVYIATGSRVGRRRWQAVLIPCGWLNMAGNEGMYGKFPCEVCG